jgi:hypothetical protein
MDLPAKQSKENHTTSTISSTESFAPFCGNSRHRFEKFSASMMTVSPALSENLSDVPMARRPSRRFRARWLAVLAAAGCSFCTFRLGPLLGDQGRSGGW